MSTTETIWVGIGATGQVCFGLRMLVQWWVSEQRGESVVPRAFWYFSLAGALMVLSYAVYRRDPIFIAGQLLPLAIYVRNLMLISRKRPADRETVRLESQSGPSGQCGCPCTCGARRAA
jgi:lipid-A-disaccharide synthase-like uncharacterized protein